jgi:hypothetical protein
MGTREMTNTKNCRKYGTRNIENTRRKWSENQEKIEERWNERIENTTRSKAVNQESTEREWSEKIANITRNRVVVATKNVRITTSIVGTENAPMTNIVITWNTIIKGIDTTITAIGGLGSNGIDTEKNILTYTNMEDITAKMHI